MKVIKSRDLEKESFKIKERKKPQPKPKSKQQLKRSLKYFSEDYED